VEPLLQVDRLRVEFSHPDGPIEVVRGASFGVRSGEFVGLVGESGSGKTLSALSVLRLLPSGGRISGGSIHFGGKNLIDLGERELQKVRGGKVGFVFQEPSTALNPVFTIGSQIAEGVRLHHRVSRKEALDRACELLERVSIPDPRKRLKSYPHELSGGQRQRVMIAIALAAGPELLIADEPTTALDVTVQAEILALLEELRAELGLAVLLITHDLAVVAETCDRVFVMYAGEVVEEASVERLFSAPAHPYSRGLLDVVPRLGTSAIRGSKRVAAADRAYLPVIPGGIPLPGSLPPGCVFEPRCGDAMDRCGTERPVLVELGAEPGAASTAPETAHRAACFLHEKDLIEGEKS